MIEFVVDSATPVGDICRFTTSVKQLDVARRGVEALEHRRDAQYADAYRQPIGASLIRDGFKAISGGRVDRPDRDAGQDATR
jgi:hypothetical protein